ncbi:MAG: hypothetical protein HFF02_04035 [Erysipelotrichaceae bacterium]|nr:hypothetical protein [Erysipelotrichaceae bacterium]
MAKIKKTIITAGRSSYMTGFGTLEVREVNKPYEYDGIKDGVKGKLVSTKIRVLCDEQNEFFDISVMRVVTEDELKKGDLVDFINFGVAVSASAQNGFQGQAANGWLDLSYKADDVKKVDEHGNFITEPKKEPQPQKK